MFEQNNRDVTSIPGYVIEKNSSREKMCFQAKQMLKRHVKESTDAILRYLHDGTPANRTELRCQPSGGKKNT